MMLDNLDHVHRFREELVNEYHLDYVILVSISKSNSIGQDILIGEDDRIFNDNSLLTSAIVQILDIK
jgi:hypothetical protein